MTDGYQFAHPEFLFLLLALPILAIWKAKRGRPVAVKMPSTTDALRVGAKPRSRAGAFSLFLTLLGLALLIGAFARPRHGKGSSEVEASGIDIVLAIDVSGSMQAMDFKLNGRDSDRLEVVKDVVGKFVKERPNDRIGIVAFAGRPYLVSPLTLDQDFLAKRVSTLQMGQVEDGTAIGSAIASATTHLKDSNAKSRIMILLTDGVNNAGAINPPTAAEAAKALGIKIYTIGVGTRGKAPMPVQDMFGQRRFQMMDVEIDEQMLAEIANSTGGQGFRATDTTSLKDIYEAINQLEKTTRKLKKYQQYEELFLWLLIPGMALLLLETTLNQTLFRRLP